MTKTRRFKRLLTPFGRLALFIAFIVTFLLPPQPTIATNGLTAGNLLSNTRHPVSAALSVVTPNVDFNRDGNTDILWRNQNGQVHVWLMNGTQQASKVDIGPPVLSEWQIQGTGDFNRDGNTDILWRNQNGQVHTWLMNGTQQASRVDIGPPVLSEWQIQTKVRRV
jgi:hypothetical protein